MKLVKEIKNFEQESIEKICKEMTEKMQNFTFNAQTKKVRYQNEDSDIKNITCVIEKDGHAYILSKCKKIKIRVDE
jgi:beta-lactamase class D